MKKPVPDPPVLGVRQDLSTNEAIALSSDHLQTAVELTDTLPEAVSKAVLLQMDIATMLLKVAADNQRK